MIKTENSLKFPKNFRNFPEKSLKKLKMYRLGGGVSPIFSMTVWFWLTPPLAMPGRVYAINIKSKHKLQK